MRQVVKLLGSSMSLCAALMLFPPAACAEFDRGQALYENHCRLCHEGWAHARDGSNITSLQSLRQRVAAWSVHSGLEWGDDEIGDVTDYLNRHFYRLTVKP
jgi:hypothetical protein